MRIAQTPGTTFIEIENGDKVAVSEDAVTITAGGGGKTSKGYNPKYAAGYAGINWDATSSPAKPAPKPSAN